MLKFWTIAKEETDNWDADTLARNGIRAAFGLYLIKEGEGTHLCELTPSSCALWMQNVFILEDEEAAANWQDPEGLAHENGGESFTYFRFVDVEKHDSRFLAGPIEIDPEELDGADEWGAAQEAWNQSGDHPRITWEATFDAWQAEQSAKRRAENVPPLSHRGDGMLPLFYAAAVKIIAPGFVSRPEHETQFRAMGWL
jgi:hypothetical protein